MKKGSAQEHGEGTPFSSGTSQHSDSCPVALEIPRNGSKTELLCLQRWKWLAFAASKPAQYSQELERDHLSQAHKNA